MIFGLLGTLYARWFGDSRCRNALGDHVNAAGRSVVSFIGGLSDRARLLVFAETLDAACGEAGCTASVHLPAVENAVATRFVEGRALVDVRQAGVS